MTTMIAGPAHDFSDDQLHRMIEAAGDLLSRTPPIAVTLGQILYHPEAIMLAVTPAQALMPVRDAVQAATQLVTGKTTRRYPAVDPPRDHQLQHIGQTRRADHCRSRPTAAGLRDTGQRSQPRHPARTRTSLGLAHHRHRSPSGASEDVARRPAARDAGQASKPSARPIPDLGHELTLIPYTGC